jgi:hypothetical protein
MSEAGITIAPSESAKADYMWHTIWDALQTSVVKTQQPSHMKFEMDSGNISVRWVETKPNTY